MGRVMRNNSGSGSVADRFFKVLIGLSLLLCFYADFVTKHVSLDIESSPNHKVEMLSSFRSGSKTSPLPKTPVETKTTPPVHQTKDSLTNKTAEEAIAYTPRLKKRRRVKNKSTQKDENRTLSPEEKLKYTFEETAMMSNLSNTVFYRDIPAEFLTPDPGRFVWDRPELGIPEWMKDYFRWHRYKRTTWESTPGFNWTESYKSERWLISQCLMSQDKRRCGGTADRLKPVPSLIRKAYDTKRVYLIRWTRPARLEEFLMPPKGGLDWRVPPELGEILEDGSIGKRLTTTNMISKYAISGMSLVRCRFQHNSPSHFYNDMVFGENYTSKGIITNPIVQTDEPNFDSVFSGIWKTMFTPSATIQSLLKTKLEQLRLVPNRYTSVHLRALYAVDSRDENTIQQFTTNALACATELNPDGPIFFASDSNNATQYALDFNTPRKDRKEFFSGEPPTGLTVVSSAPNPDPPWHLDSYIGPVENFYDTFLDLYLLAMGSCLTYSKGGFGHWGLLIGGNLGCSTRQHWIGRKWKNAKETFCHFPNDTVATRTSSTSSRIFGNDGDDGPLFLPPMT